MGFDACVMAVKYAKRFGATCVVDPFCGKGSVLAIANHFGLNWILAINNDQAKLCMVKETTQDSKSTAYSPIFEFRRKELLC